MRRIQTHVRVRSTVALLLDAAENDAPGIFVLASSAWVPNPRVGHPLARRFSS